MSMVDSTLPCSYGIISEHSHRGPYNQHMPMLSQRRHCGDPLELFAEPGPSSITEAMEGSEYDADDSSSMISSFVRTRMMTLIGGLPVGTNTFKKTSSCKEIEPVPFLLSFSTLKQFIDAHACPELGWPITH